MKKFFITAALLSSIALGGCAQFQALGTGFSILTASVTNPVTPTMMYEAESGFRIVVAALEVYKKACAAGSADKPCKANVAAVQKYTLQIPPYLVQVRTFVAKNDQLNAVNTYNALVALITQAKTTATNLGVNIGG
jgi:hypothetical protein